MNVKVPEPKIIVRPLHTKLKFDVERGTKVRVVSEIDGCVEGIVFQNPKSHNPSFLELHDARIVFSEKGKRVEQPIGLHRVDATEVDTFEILHQRKVVDKLYKSTDSEEVIERMLRTFVISNLEKFNELVAMLEGVTEVAMNVYGIYVGRLGDVGWIALYLKCSLVLIDVLEGEKRIHGFWEQLDKVLFSNPKIRKVVYNSRPISDFLYHKKCIMVKNMQDIQVFEASVQCMQLKPGLSINNLIKMSYKKLSEMIQTYLGDVVPPKEVESLQKFENEDFSASSPLMFRPIEDKAYCKYVALDMKYLLAVRYKLLDALQNALAVLTNQQIEGIVNNSNGEMEHQLDYPEEIPQGVVAKLAKFFGPVNNAK